MVAYVRWTGEPDSVADALRRYARGRLPASLVPSAFVQVTSFPVLANGTLDLAALAALPAWPDGGVPPWPDGGVPPWPDGRVPRTGEVVPPTGYVAARTPMEQTLCELWAELLDRPDVGVADDFFDLGGDSLLAARLVYRIRSTFGVELAIRRCLELSTVADYAFALLDLQLQQTEYDIDEVIAAIQTGRTAPLAVSVSRRRHSRGCGAAP